MGNYNDIYMRAYLGDPGNVPRSTSQPLSASPDLIPYGTQPVDPSTFLTDASWNKAYNATMQTNQDNYLYMRAQNLGTDTSTGTFSLYSSPGSLLLWPSTWASNQLKTQRGELTQSITLAGNAKGVLPSAFVWRPQTTEHYCLVGMVSTPAHPATIPPDGSIQDFALWIAQNGSFAWHNLSVTDAGSPTWTKTINYKQGTTTDIVSFDLVCTNVPVGSYVSISCGLSGPNPPISLAKTQVTTSPSFVVGVQSSVPAGFVGDISYSYWAQNPSAPPPPGFTITLRASIFEDGSESKKLYAYSSTAEEMGYPTPEDYLAHMKAVQKWSTLPWSAHEAYADYLLKEHQHARTYSAKSQDGPVKRFSVGSDTNYAQPVSQQ